MTTQTRRRIRSYHAMNEDKLKQCYKDFVNYHNHFFDRSYGTPEAVQLCMDKGSGDPNRDMNEIEHIAEIRMIDLED